MNTRLKNLPWKSIAKEALERSFIVAKFLCVLHVTNTYICSIALAYGPSMLPTLNLTGDIVLIDKVTTRFGKIGTGDVLLVRSPREPRKFVTKRVLGLEGDKVTYLIDSDRSKTIMVPKGHIWIQGDNIYSSTDSRHYGPVPYGLVQGRVFCRIWPFSGFGPLERVV